MSCMIFEHDEKLRALCWTKEGFQFAASLYLVFHQIFLYRLKDIELDINKYKQYHPLTDISNFDESYRFTLYTVYQNIISTVENDWVLKENFHIFNSYEKISFEAYSILIRKKIPDFQDSQLFQILQNQTFEEITAFDMRLIADFGLTEEWVNYMNRWKHL